jgi:hypothetical protein
LANALGTTLIEPVPHGADPVRARGALEELLALGPVADPISAGVL